MSGIGIPRLVLLDANVLYPTVLREMLLGVAATGAFSPLWSKRILEEWARATRRLPDGAEALARAEIKKMKAAWPEADVPRDHDLEAQLSLPDPADRHVLAAAINGGAETLLTFNRTDFPSRVLARHDILLREPDGFLVELAAEEPDFPEIAAKVKARAEARWGRPYVLRTLLKRTGLPRLGKLLDPAA